MTAAILSPAQKKAGRIRLNRLAMGPMTVTGTEKIQVSPILLPFARIHTRAMGLAAGVVAGGVVWFATAILLLKGGYPLGPNLSLLSQYFPGYSVSWTGAFIGLAWGVAIGYIGGWSFAAIRNLVFRLWLVIVRSRVEKEQYRDILDRL